MKVKLIQMTQNPIDVMWTAARTCYSAKSPIEMWEDKYGETSDGCEHTQEWIEQCTEKHWNLVKKVLDSGHQSIAEHVYFTFAIEGVNRALTHQLVRHRIGVVYSQQSQRYVNEKNGFEFEVPQSIQKVDELHNEFYALMQHIQNFYNKAIEYDIKPEDARSVLPNAALSNITLSINLRELIHVCNLRLCTRAQKEIRDLFGLIVKEVKNADERLASYLVPQCEVRNMCFEDKCCGRKPKLEEVLEGYERYKDLNK
jgi:thymidylate synthase (FAD)